MRDIVEPTVDEHGYEVHPAWGMISVHRSQVMTDGHGAVLFDSDITHHHVMTVRLSEASRKRQLNRDHKMAGKIIAEVAFSEAQWAAFIASTNQGQGTPCTIQWRESLENPQVPGMPYSPRIQESLTEVRGAAEHSMQKIREAFAAVKEKPTKGNIRHLEAMIDNAPSNMVFAATSLAEAAETVVQNARADIESFAADAEARRGLEPGTVMGTLPELTPGEGDA